jgi:hypothetical protein
MNPKENLEQVQKEKIAAEAINVDAAKHAEEDKKMRENAIELRESKKDEIMQPHEAMTVKSF